ncbi:MAG: hypothetical protein KatS3mg031_2543 [Chitinophagales bacterium]|nr:MAG: hypothetical protein KatS3mg031_2543 [Chitinophagales bacterium]
MNTSNIFGILILVVFFTGLFSSCKEEEDNNDNNNPNNPNAFVINSNITTNTTWETGKVYILAGRIAVTNGATLTIQKGVVIKGEVGSGANASALIITRGSRILAEGTASEPIIFTSVADEIQPGQIASPNLDASYSGLWGGLLVLGRAPISADAEAVQIEGIPPSDQNGLYGGTDPNDNSGVLKYISIRHGGANIGEGNEINGLTLGGVGSGTVVENIEIVSNQDDGIEIFGGTVDVKNILVWNPEDDAIDVDQGWSGSLENFVVICGSQTDHALEIDGPEGSLLAGGTVFNGSIKGSPSAELGDFRDNARGTYRNIYFFNFPDPAENGKGDLSLSSGSDATFNNGSLIFENLQITPINDTIALSVIFRNGTHVHATKVAKGANTVGSNKTSFTGWSWADADGQLTDF